MSREARFSRHRTVLRQITNKSILQALAPLVNLDVTADHNAIKQALVTKFPINGLIIICKPKKIQGLQALLAPADLTTFHPPAIPNNFPILLVDGEYEFNEEQFTSNWIRIANHSTNNKIDIASLEKERDDGSSTSKAGSPTKIKAEPDK